MFTAAHEAVPCAALIEKYEQKKAVRNARKLAFRGVEGFDVYNISVPFACEGKTYIAGRVEKRDTEWSAVRFFERVAADTYAAAFPDTVFHSFQDPFVTFVRGELVLGGVQIQGDPLSPQRIVSWHTCLYRGKSPDKLSLFAIGPSHMKDIRLCALDDGRVAAFTRPQGRKGGRGRIGFMLFDSLDVVNGEDMLGANIYPTHFLPEEWGGANDVHLLSNGLLGVMGHISRRDGQGLHYYPMCFVLDPQTGAHSPVAIVASRADFPPGPSKRPDLKDVLFTAGIIRNKGGTATLYTGVSDCEASCAEIADPFLSYE